jgi:hypothetical protein
MSGVASSNEKRIITDIREIVPAGTKKYICSINEYHHVPGWMKQVTYYVIQTVSLGAEIPERGKVSRRYKEFETLCTQLKAKYGDIIPEFLTPRNRLLEDHFTQEFLDARRLLLADWMNKVINLNDQTKNDDLISEFLDLKRSTAYDDAIGSSKTATFGGDGSGITQIFSVTQSDKVKLTEKDYDYIPVTGEVMTVHRITDDDL